jgi:hypothetical protein
MSSTLTIPADVVPEVRVGLVYLIGDATGQLDEILPLSSRDLDPEWYMPARRMLEEVFVLLDRVGWSSADSEREVEIDVREHGRRIAEALEIALSGLADQLKEADINDRRRLVEGLPPRKREIVRQIRMVREFAAAAVEEAIDASGA